MVICAERKSDLITTKKAYSRHKRFWLYCVRSEQKLSCFSEIWLRFGVNWRIVRIWVTEFWTHKKCKKTVLSAINWACLVSVIIKTKSGLIYSSQFILFFFIFFFTIRVWDSRELGCLPFGRKIRLGCRKHNGKRFIRLPQSATSVTVWIHKGGEFV